MLIAGLLLPGDEQGEMKEQHHAETPMEFTQPGILIADSSSSQHGLPSTDSQNALLHEGILATSKWPNCHWGSDDWRASALTAH